VTAVVQHANTDLVAVAFIKTILDWTGNVGADLPDAASWDPDGFVQVTSGIGGSSSIFVPMRSPVVSVKCWARAAANSRRPRWNQANKLAEAIRAGCFTAYREPVGVTLPAGYPGAAVRTAYLLTEPRRLPGDDSSYACFQFDMQLNWTEVPV
jgi:hypothetical protein